MSETILYTVYAVYMHLGERLLVTEKLDCTVYSMQLLYMALWQELQTKWQCTLYMCCRIRRL